MSDSRGNILPSILMWGILIGFLMFMGYATVTARQKWDKEEAVCLSQGGIYVRTRATQAYPHVYTCINAVEKIDDTR